MFFWVTFTDRPAGSIEGDGRWYPTSEEAAELRGATSEERAAAHTKRRDAVRADVRARAEKLGKVKTIETLPYPAVPVLDQRSNCPAFCWNPNTCQGRTSCPRRRSCDD